MSILIGSIANSEIEIFVDLVGLISDAFFIPEFFASSMYRCVDYVNLGLMFILAYNNIALISTKFHLFQRNALFIMLLL